MNLTDYREKLGIGFNDDEKFVAVKNYISNLLLFNSGSIKYIFDTQGYLNFCFKTGVKILNNMDIKEHVFSILENQKSMYSYLYYYIAFANECAYGTVCFQYLNNAFNQFRIPFDIIEDKDGCFIFPKGASELDNALVSDVLEWLTDYPQTYKTFVIALKQYSACEYVRDVADNLRKALEEFLKEFLKNEKNLINNINEIGKYLKTNNVNENLSNMLVTLMRYYDKFNNEVVKHNDKIDERFLEFLLYQTGLFIRMIITLK